MRKPCIIEFHFVRDSKRKFDFHNMVQLPLDLMTAYDIIEDDNMDCVIPIPYTKNGKWYSVDKEKAGLYIRVGEVIW
jgi:Holliday junction resolvase RusA-like endonuclease